jgi:hypothetical protein
MRIDQIGVHLRIVPGCDRAAPRDLGVGVRFNAPFSSILR